MGILDNARDIVRQLAVVAGVQRDAFDETVVKAIPQDIVDSANAQGMSSSVMLGPGQALTPVDGFSRVPRALDYQTGVNITNRPRSNQRVSFTTLRALVDGYDIAQIAITHRIDSIRSYSWAIVAEDGNADVQPEDIAAEIATAQKMMRSPDGELPFKAWLAKWIYDVLAFDAGCLYKMRNVGGAATGLLVVDGTTIAPLLNEHGTRPKAPAEAFVQYIQGQVWNWLTEDDLIYVPFRPASNSPYGRAPIESVLINANTDIRFQMYFMQKFTAGTIPEGFGIAPESWTPDQLTQWQNKWDALLYGDQEVLHQIKWVPGGTRFEFPNEKDFDDRFSLFLARKTFAAFHVPPTDAGFTDTANRSTGDSQASVSERVGDLPLKEHIQDILTSFLQNDMGLRVKFQFDDGGEDEDKLKTAQLDKIYLDAGVVGGSEVRELRFGLSEADGQIMPRYVMTPKGPVALSSLFSASGEVDPETGGPKAGSTMPAVQQVVQQIDGIVEEGPSTPVTKVFDDGVKAELAAFRKFAKAREASGRWRDFTFTRVDRVAAHRLNTAGFAAVRKTDGDPTAAGLCVRAADTGRVLMLQRALDPTDPASGKIEFPGGHIEPGETPLDAACREWEEEVGLSLPWLGANETTWTSGTYVGFVVDIASEELVPPHDRGDTAGVNPDDPDGDCVEAIFWVNPGDLVGNLMIRDELARSLPAVLAALLNPSDPSQEAMPPLPVAKSWRDSANISPAHRYDLAITDHYTPQVEKAIAAIAKQVDVGALITQFSPLIAKSAGSDLAQIIRAQMDTTDIDTAMLAQLLDKIVTDGYSTGYISGVEQLGAHAVTATGLLAQAIVDIDWSKWVPGDPRAVMKVADGALRATLDGLGITVQGVSNSVLDEIGNRIGDGLAAGLGSDAIERNVRDLVGGVAGTVSTRAERIVYTEVARAQTLGAFDTFTAAGVTQYNLLVSSGACPICTDLESGNPYDLNDDSAQVPIHPFCRCADSPVEGSIDSSLINAQNADDGSTDPTVDSIDK